MRESDVLEVLEPTAEAVVEPGELAQRLDSLDGKKIGLFDNTKLNASELMDLVEAELRSRHRLEGVVRGTYNPARVMHPDEWQGVDDCDAVILTHGD